MVKRVQGGQMIQVENYTVAKNGNLYASTYYKESGEETWQLPICQI
jgi:hypothetical protein